MVTAVQIIALLLVAGGAIGVVATRNPLCQAIVAGVYGLALTILFVVFQAPDVALSELLVGGVLVPALVLLALDKTREPPS
jgi:energy-converting hydrogenase B subunit D